MIEKKRTTVFITLFILALCTVGVGAYFYSSTNKEKGNLLIAKETIQPESKKTGNEPDGEKEKTLEAISNNSPQIDLGQKDDSEETDTNDTIQETKENQSRNEFEKGLISRDTNGDKTITREEYGADRKFFALLDRDRDGVIDEDESSVAAEYAQKVNPYGSTEELFAHNDIDGDGKLSQKEIKKIPLIFFNKIDSDGDGLLSIEELGGL